MFFQILPCHYFDCAVLGSIGTEGREELGGRRKFNFEGSRAAMGAAVAVGLGCCCAFEAEDFMACAFAEDGPIRFSVANRALLIL